MINLESPRVRTLFDSYVLVIKGFGEEREKKILKRVVGHGVTTLRNSITLIVEASHPCDPRSCQMDARSQPILSFGSVVPTKDVRTGCSDTPSDGFVSHVYREINQLAFY